MRGRIADYRGIDRWTPLNLMSTVGAVLTGLSILPFVWNVAISLRKGELAFHHLPEIHSERPVFDLRHGLGHPEAGDSTDPQTKPERG